MMTAFEQIDDEFAFMCHFSLFFVIHFILLNRFFGHKKIIFSSLPS